MNPEASALLGLTAAATTAGGAILHAHRVTELGLRLAVILFGLLLFTVLSEAAEASEKREALL